MSYFFFLLLTNQEVFIKKITSDGTKETLAVYTVPTVKEKVIRGDVQLTKFAEGKDPETEKKVPLEGINFKLTSKTNGQSWTIVTDKNGFASFYEHFICVIIGFYVVIYLYLCHILSYLSLLPYFCYLH